MNSTIFVEKSDQLEGSIEVSGAKNSILPILCASLLTTEKIELENVPNLKDVEVLREILHELGKNSEISDDKLVFHKNPNPQTGLITISESASRIRYSILILGSLLGLGREVHLPLPGGCSFSDRPIDIHLDGLRDLGAIIEEYPNKIVAKTKRLKGANIVLRFPSVGATENLIIAATLAEGVTILENAAREPEIDDLIEFLNKMGANIKYIGPSKIKIIGVDTLTKSVVHAVIPDRIETATFIILGALASKSSIIIEKIEIHHNLAILNLLQKVGVNFEILDNNSIKVYRSNELMATSIKTNVYPEIATDIQPLLAVLLTQVNGESEIIDTIYPSRFQYVEFLNSMGAKIDYDKKLGKINIKGKSRLNGKKVFATDLRGGAAVLLSGIIADGETEINNSYQVFRGYSNLKEKLTNLKVKINN